MSALISFADELDHQINVCSQSACQQLVYCAETGARALTNAVFLLGAYLILRLDMTPDGVAQVLNGLDPTMIATFRDATFIRQDFGLTLQDCWRGLYKGKDSGWVAAPSDPSDPLWGMIDPDEYRHYESPAQGDLHEVVPGKIIAFRGPADLRGSNFVDKSSGCRDFAPEHYAGIFKDFGVSTVIRLNEPRYDGEAFRRCGIEHFDLEFEDCTSPPNHIAVAFLRIVHRCLTREDS